MTKEMLTMKFAYYIFFSALDDSSLVYFLFDMKTKPNIIKDKFLPTANISRIMKQVLPENAKISKEAKEVVQVFSFVHHYSFIVE